MAGVRIEGNTSGNVAEVDASNNIKVVTTSIVDGKPMYSAACRNITPPATPSDFCILNGSASKTIRVLRMILSTTQTTAGVNEFFIVKRSTANSGGTSTSPTICPYDSNNAAAQATVLQYSANPTTGATVANVLTARMLTPTTTSATQAYVVIDFTSTGLTSSGIVLRGAAQGLAFNFNGAALPTGLNVNCTYEWTEE